VAALFIRCHTDRSEWRSLDMLRVRRPIEVVVLNCLRHGDERGVTERAM
jgi:hypothetical protein